MRNVSMTFVPLFKFPFDRLVSKHPSRPLHIYVEDNSVK